MKALVGIATAAIAVLAAGGIKAALPGAPADPAGSEGTATRVRVVAVLDGDTLRVEDLDGGDLGRVRLLGIDAPEVAHPPTPAECYSSEATDQLERLAPVGHLVVVTSDTGQPDQDRYGRMLRYVGHADTDAARELLAAGAARVYDADQQLARDTDYAAAQDAHSAETGLWATADHQVIAPTPGPDLGDQEDWRSRCRSVEPTGSHHERLRRSRGSST